MHNSLHTITLSFLFSLFLIPLFCQCPENLYPNHQWQIDTFPILYPNCDSISGRVWIDEFSPIGSGSKIYDLSPYQQIEYIGDGLFVMNTHITEIDLPNLQTVDECIALHNNDELENIDFTDQLINTTVPLLIQISKNDKLKTVKLDVKSEGTLDVTVNQNDSLVLLSLPNLDTINSLSLYQNKLLTFIDFKNLHYINGSLSVRSNDALDNYNWIKEIEYIGESIEMVDNKNLSSLDLTKTKGFNDEIRIDSNDVLESFYFDNAEIDSLSDLNIVGNDLLTTFSGFEELEHVKSYLRINNNKSLVSVPSFKNLDTVGWQFQLNSNENLTDISGFSNSNYLGRWFFMNDNLQLSICSYPSICNHFEVAKKIFVDNNALGCENEDQILENCNVSAIEAEIRAINIYPNPFTDQLTVDLEKEDEWTIKIYDVRGSLRHKEQHHGSNIELDLDYLDAGVYVLQCISAYGQYSKKIVKN